MMNLRAAWDRVMSSASYTVTIFAPSRAGSEGDAVVANFSLGLQVLECLPYAGISDGRGIRVVQLQDVHVGRGESIKRLVDGGLDRARREVGTAVRAAHLARDDDEFASILECLP